MSEYIAIGAAVLVVAGVIVKKTKNKTDDKWFKIISDTFKKLVGK